MSLPVWVQVVIAAGAVVTAAYAIWLRVLLPAIQFGTMLERVLPAMAVLAEAFPKGEDLADWLDAVQGHRTWTSQRIANIERVIDRQHPPPRDWDWQHPPDRRASPRDEPDDIAYDENEQRRWP